MSKMRKTMELDRYGIDRIADMGELKEFLKRLLDDLEEFYKVIYDNIENGMVTENWRIREVDGNFELQHYESGTWVNRGFKYKGS